MARKRNKMHSDWKRSINFFIQRSYDHLLKNLTESDNNLGAYETKLRVTTSI